MTWKVKREVLFERTLPEARWSCSRYVPPKPKRKWILKPKA